MKPVARTTDGASIYLTYERRRKLVRITIDRWPVLDGTANQCSAIRDLAIQEWTKHVTVRTGRRESTAFLDSPSIWEFWTLREREQIVLAEIDRIEREVR